jgi:hypothetical protein
MSEIIAKLLTGILVFYQLLFLLCMISFEAFVLCELGNGHKCHKRLDAGRKIKLHKFNVFGVDSGLSQSLDRLLGLLS